MAMDSGHVLVGRSSVECWNTGVYALDPVEVAGCMVELGDTKGVFKVSRELAVFGTMFT